MLRGGYQLKTTASLSATRIHEWPRELKKDLAWEPSSFQSEADYTLVLSNEEISEIRMALKYFNGMYPF